MAGRLGLYSYIKWKAIQKYAQKALKKFKSILSGQIQSNFQNPKIWSESAADGWSHGLCRSQKWPLWLCECFLTKFTRPASMAASILASELVWGQKTLCFCSFDGFTDRILKWSVFFCWGSYKKICLVKKFGIIINYLSPDYWPWASTFDFFEFCINI